MDEGSEMTYRACSGPMPAISQPPALVSHDQQLLFIAKDRVPTSECAPSKPNWKPMAVSFKTPLVHLQCKHCADAPPHASGGAILCWSLYAGHITAVFMTTSILMLQGTVVEVAATPPAEQQLCRSDGFDVGCTPVWGLPYLRAAASTDQQSQS